MRRRDLVLGAGLLAAILALSQCVSGDDKPSGPGSGEPQLWINEILADNGSVNEDPDFGAAADWVELYNSGNAAAALDGLYLTDDPGEPTKWAVPHGTAVPAGGFLLVWADDEDTLATALHASFKLSKDGEFVGLYDGTVCVDSVTFGEQQEDVSYGRVPDGAAAWAPLEGPSPGTPNQP